ncbi:MAG: UTP--glucose-1-phosphate uridylyltransferase GalU [Gammaproteobacteria bacterium]|nr:UTP--glucose-1-phosphate uridylyltransferase GalU [Gammaproteobacteria bacterium]MDH5593924.1 UTP--glucose-1-phosphate uridylyltransferase GalU [Gammaproteobacteria bacterium]MDH5614012.1 UTP--glucose-1-phosphate uridylyltransferase GalU [Gammaproteobacteria bacterium]
MSKIRKIVFPVAGMGTRFLPATKASAKEMMPVVDKPLIQYAAEEAIAAGYDQLIFVTGRGKRAIADHFDVSYELEMELEARGKEELLKEVRKILPSHVDIVYVRQPQPLGLGHAVLMAKRVVGNEAFAITLADDLIDGFNKPVLAQMNDVFERTGRSVLAVEDVPKDETHKYGIVDSVPLDDKTGRLKGIVEKPDPASAPSNLAVVGRYILTPRIFEILESTDRGAGGEIQLTDAIAKLLQEQDVISYRYDGKRYDCGSKLGYLIANIEYGLKHPELKSEFNQYLKKFSS